MKGAQGKCEHFENSPFVILFSLTTAIGKDKWVGPCCLALDFFPHSPRPFEEVISMMDSQPVDVSAEQLEAVLRETNAMTAAFKRAQRVRLISFLVLLLFVAGLSWFVIAKAKAFASDKNLEKIADIAGKHLEKNQEKYLKQLQMLVDRVSPPISQALYAQAKKDSPQFFNTIEKERQPFLDELGDKFRD